MTGVSVDKLDLSTLLSKTVFPSVSRPVTNTAQFWSTAPRVIKDATKEIIEFTFTGGRLVNYVQALTANFPHTITAQYQDQSSTWHPLRVMPILADQGQVIPKATTVTGDPVKFSVSHSIPKKVNLTGVSTGTGWHHPQHFGAGHWVSVSWQVTPVITTKIRLILVRSAGSPPVDPRGHAVAYSLGLSDVQIGYRVNSRADIPSSANVVREDFGSSIDLLGSRVLFSLTEQPAKNAISGDPSKAWRSEPQPVNYAVVNFYADTRDASGYGQVIDRFYLDPLTVGVHASLYYSNDVPDSDFRSLDEPLEYPVSQSFGASAIPLLDPQQTVVDKAIFSVTNASYVDVNNTHLQFDPSRAWWLGMEQEGTTTIDTAGDHPWVSFGGNTLRLNGPVIEFISATGKVGTVPLDPDHSVNTRFSIVVIFNPVGTHATHPLGYPDGLTLVYHLIDRPPVTTTWAMTAADLGTRPTTFSIGRYNDSSHPGLPAMTLRALVLKIDAPPADDDIALFFVDGSVFAKRDEFSGLDSGATNNALLRMHPTFSVAATNPIGLVGGPGDRFADMVWTPIARDYVLRQGFLNLPPTRARFFKFEFTNLISESYESFVPIRRGVQLFSSATVEAYRQMTAGKSFSALSGGPGVQTQIDLTNVARYSDALNLVTTSASRDATHSATEALVVADPVQASAAALSGWVWGFQPWHVGSGAPRFVYTQKHVYEKVYVNHVTKVGYFVGLKTLKAYRVDYMADDETEIFYEHFHDQANIASTNGVDWSENKIFAYGSSSEVVSKAFVSARPVHAVQFSSIQSDAFPMLSDDGFFDPDLSLHWSVYGDATLVRASDQTVIVNRGWFHLSYGQEEAKYVTYGGMNGHLYAELEGALPNGLVGGGINSVAVTPGGSGRLYASVKVSSVTTMSGPVRLEIVAFPGGQVLASADRMIKAGQEEVFFIGYTPGSVTTPLPYSLIESTRIIDGVTTDTSTTVTTVGSRFAATDVGRSITGTGIPTGATIVTFTSATSVEISAAATVTATSVALVVGHYSDLEGTTYQSHQSSPIDGNVYVRLIQTGPSTDTFVVRRLSLFDAPLSWEFSNDSGDNWFDAMDIRNDPDGVLSFPTTGTQLCWRLRMFRPDTTVSALTIRPWYGGI